MATYPRLLSLANHLRLPKHLITETAIYLPISGRLNLYGLKLTFIEELLLLFFTIFNGYFYLQVIFLRWLARPKRRQIFYNYSLCLISLWFSNEFNCGLNDLHLFLVLGVVATGLLTCVVRFNSSDPFIESCNSYSEFLQSTFNGEDDELSVWGSYELKRDSSHLTSDLKRRRILVAEVEPVSGYETPIIDSEKVTNRELSNDTETEDLFGLREDLRTEIVKKLHAFHDFAILSTVSKVWRSACSNLKWSLYAPHPWSIHFQGQNIMEHLDDGRYVLERWDEIDGRYYYGWVNGWILSIGSEHISIFNLFSRTETNLPTLSRVGYLRITEPSDWYRYIYKFILFKACHDDNLQFLVVAPFGPRGFIAFTGPQFQDWICIESDDLHLFLVLGVVATGLLTCVARLNSSDPFIESCNSYSEFLQSTFNGEDDELSVWGSYELKRDSSHLTLISYGESPPSPHTSYSPNGYLPITLRYCEAFASVLNKCPQVSPCCLPWLEPVIGYETPIIDSEKVTNRELSNDTETEDLFGLQEDLLTEILKKLHAFHDFANLSTVSKVWRSACSNLKWSLYAPHPWSIHFQGQNIMEHLDDGRYVLERWKIDGRYYYGWVNGWILSIGSEHISIVNHFSRTKRNLPILSRVGYLPITKPNDWYNYIEKFILFKACHDDNLQFLVVALFGSRGFIAFTGPQFQDWIFIESDDIACCSDVVLFQGRFYALCGRGKLFLCAFDRSNPCVSLVSEQPLGSFRADKYYLVKNVDHFIAIFQDRNWDSGVKRFGTKTFSIYRTDDDMDWTRIREPIYLIGRTLFISNGNSWIINPAKVENCRTNSIYFVDDYWFSNNRDGHLIGVFDIANGEIEDFEFEMDQYPPNDVSPFSLTYNDGA